MFHYGLKVKNSRFICFLLENSSFMRVLYLYYMHDGRLIYYLYPRSRKKSWGCGRLSNLVRAFQFTLKIAPVGFHSHVAMLITFGNLHLAVHVCTRIVDRVVKHKIVIAFVNNSIVLLPRRSNSYNTSQVC